MTTIHRPPAGGSAHAPDHEPLQYVTLTHLRIGDKVVPPGTLLTAEDMKGRNVKSMLRERLVQQHIAPAGGAE